MFQLSFLHLRYRYILLLLIFITFSLFSRAQTSRESESLENSLSAVVTVGVYETDAAKKSLGFRGSPSDMAYAHMLDLTGASGSGSGFFIKYNGRLYVITNAHVIEQASDASGSIYIYTINNTKYKARVKGGDSFYDLAVLELEKEPGTEVSFLEIRNTPARIGERVYAIGNPLGEYPYSVSEGIISAKNRVRQGLTGKFGFLQTTATVIWGNSGGPLIDKDGKLLGVNSQIAFADQGGSQIWQPQINFALESEIVSRLVKDILTNNGVVTRSYLGAEFSQRRLAYEPGSKEYSYYAKTLTADTYPVITNIIEGGPAQLLKPYLGYSIIAVNGESTRNLEEVLGELEKSKPGQAVSFSLSKGGETKTVSITSSALRSAGSASIGKMLMDLAGATYTQGQNKLFVRLGQSREGSGTREIITSVKDAKPATGAAASGEWEVLGIGLLEDKAESLWRVADIADAGTAARLTGLSGVVDIILFRKGGDPRSEDSYIKKRIILSGTNGLVKKTLWY